jgi:hypothetical protein
MRSVTRQPDLPAVDPGFHIAIGFDHDRLARAKLDQEATRLCEGDAGGSFASNPESA